MLEYLWLQDNPFTGTFPVENLDNLNVKDFCLGNNGFTGTPPADMETDYTLARDQTSLSNKF